MGVLTRVNDEPLRAGNLASTAGARYAGRDTIPGKRMQISLPLIVLLLIVSALIGVMRRPLTRNWRLWIAAQFLLAGVLIWASPFLQRRRGSEIVGKPKMDRRSVVASFSSISLEGPQRQLVFHYILENTTRVAFRIDQGACSRVSFRFAENSHSEPRLRSQSNPALNALEKDSRAYAKFTGLERLPATNPTLNIDHCPLELQPGERRKVVIDIPYAYPADTNQSPNGDDLKKYVRAFMPQIDGFGISDFVRNYEIDFPRGW